MKLLKVIVVITCATCIQAQAQVEKAWTILTTGAKDTNFEQRGKAIQALGLITGNARAQSMLESALQDQREEVRAAAARSLGQMQAKGSAPKLKAALKDPAASVVFGAANALFVMGDPAAYEVYYAVLTGQKKTGDALVESQMKMLKDPKALTQLGVSAGLAFVPFGTVGYKVFKTATADAVSPARAEAAMKLVGDPDPRSAQALADTAKDEKWLVRAAVIAAIAKRNNPSYLKAVTPLLDDQTDVVRFNAAAAVIHLSKK